MVGVWGNEWSDGCVQCGLEVFVQRKMSDWRSVREKQATGMRFRKEIQFGEEEVDDDDDEVIDQTASSTGVSENGNSAEEADLDEATLKALVRDFAPFSSVGEEGKFPCRNEARHYVWSECR